MQLVSSFVFWPHTLIFSSFEMFSVFTNTKAKALPYGFYFMVVSPLIIQLWENDNETNPTPEMTNTYQICLEITP